MSFQQEHPQAIEKSMFKLFRKQAAEPEIPSFKQRVRLFWDWFAEVAPSFYQTIEDKKCGDLTETMSRKVDELFPGFGWVFGPGANGVGHSFTLTGEGIEHKQLLAIQWLSQAPAIKGWTFYPSRQAGPLKNAGINVGDLKFNSLEIWVTPETDEDNERVNLTLWHPLWKEIDKNQQWTIAFLFLDEALGEYGTQWWIGEIHLSDSRLADSFPLEELPGYIEGLAAEHRWKKYPPGECYSLFNIKPSEETFPRADLITLSTSVPNLFRDHRGTEGNMDDPFEGLGADYLYVSIGRDFFPKGEEVDKRHVIEEALDTALRAQSNGWCTGGGYGLSRVYVDLLVFDGDRSLKLVRETLQSLAVPKGTTIEYFAKGKPRIQV